ncbi:MAG: hypothetical protein IKH88_06565 [Prevotella sp.]|nr:hypothetical protein [Prevotella sp.]
MRIINQNIYRLLGIYANSTLKEAVAQVSKARAYVKVGDHLETPLQMNGWLPKVLLTADVLKMVEDTLQSEEEKQRHAMFWFEQRDTADDEFIQLFTHNKTRKAMQQLDQRGDRTALKNAMVASFIMDETFNAIGYAQRLFQDENDIRTFVEEITRDKEISMESLYETCQSETWRNVLREMSFNDCNRKIEDCYTQADLVSMDDSDGMERVLRLFLSTSESLILFGKMVGKEDFYYQQMSKEFADKMLDAVKKYDNACHVTKTHPNSTLVHVCINKAMRLTDYTDKPFHWMLSGAHFKDGSQAENGGEAPGCFNSNGCGFMFVFYVFCALIGAVDKQCGSSSKHNRYRHENVKPPAIPKDPTNFNPFEPPHINLDTIPQYYNDDSERLQEVIKRMESIQKEYHQSEPIKPIDPIDPIDPIKPIDPTDPTDPTEPTAPASDPAPAPATPADTI